MLKILNFFTSKALYIGIAAAVAVIGYLLVTKAMLESKVTKLKEQNTVLTAKYDKLTSDMLTLQANIAKKEEITNQLEETRQANIKANTDLTNQQVMRMYLLTAQKEKRRHAIKKNPKQATVDITNALNAQLRSITDSTRSDLP